jgi:hypothetical protein
MKIGRLAVILGPVVLALGCGGGSMNSIGSGGGGTPPAQESVVISKSTNGAFCVAMSTSFQPAEWDSAFFTLNPEPTTLNALGSLGPHHIRLQGISQGVPQGAAGTTSTAWDF